MDKTTIIMSAVILSAAGIIVMNIKTILGFIFDHLCNLLWYSVKIEESSKFYYAVQKFVIHEKEQKIHNFYYRNIYDNFIDGEGGINLLYNYGYLIVKFNGRRILINKTNELINNTNTPYKNTKQNINLYSFSRKSINSFIDHVVLKYEKSKIQYYFNDDKEVKYLSDVTAKTFDKIFMNDNIVQNVKNDLDTFSQSEQTYIALGLKYKRTYLIHGEAGTGKSSLSTAMANHTLRHILSINLSKDMTDSTLIKIIASRPKHSIILFEDIDCLFDNLNRNAEKDSGENTTKVTLSCILNILDGAYTPNDVIFIMITNNIDKLDDAIKRDGRTDMLIHVTKPNLDTKQNYLNFVRKHLNKPTLNLDIDQDVTISTLQKNVI